MDEVLEPVTPVVEAIFGAIALPVLVYFLIINTSYLVLVVAAALEFRRSSRQLPFAGREELLGSGLVPGVSVVTSMYNEEAGIRVAAQAMLALHYPRHEVVIVDDGSSDRGFEVLRETFDLVEVPRRMPEDLAVREHATSVHVPRNGRTRLTVVRKPNSGRSDSLNVGVNFATQDLVVFVDSDSVLDPDALLAVVRPFAEDPVRMVAGGGVIRAVNGCVVRGGRVTEVRMSRNWLARIQVVEYLRAFHLGRSGWSRLKSLILISGAFGIFRRDALVEVGGLDPDSIGEDFELVLRVHRHMRRQRRDYRVEFISEPICWTEVPETTKVLRKQRRRWHRGVGDPLGLSLDVAQPALRSGRHDRRALLLGLRAARPRTRALRPRPRRRRLAARGGRCRLLPALHGRRLRLRGAGDARGDDRRGAELPQVPALA